MNQKTNEAGKLPDVQLMAGAFLTIVEAGKALSSAELDSFLSPEVEAAMSRHPDTVKPGCTGSYEQDLAAALRDIRGVADNGKPYSSSELKTVLHCGHAWRVAKRCSAEGAGSKQDGKLPEWTTADSQTADKQGWGLFTKPKQSNRT